MVASVLVYTVGCLLYEANTATHYVHAAIIGIQRNMILTIYKRVPASHGILITPHLFVLTVNMTCIHTYVYIHVKNASSATSSRHYCRLTDWRLEHEEHAHTHNGMTVNTWSDISGLVL